MILSRALYNASPPERRSRAANNPTLLYSWWCTLFSIVIIAFRLSGRYIRNERLFREDKIMAWSTLPLLARMACVHVVLIYGTNNVVLAEILHDAVKIRHREIGSRLVLAARIFYALFIWMAKFTVSEFLKRLTERFWKRGYERGLHVIRIFLVVTFFMVVIATLVECHPATHYWQVVPDPGPQCRQGYAQLLTMGIADVITDILLVAFPIPIIIRSGMPLKRKLSLVALFSLSIILIILTGARMPLVIKRRGIQQFRTVFASSEILAAAIVSNAIVLGSFLRDRGIKKTKFRAPSTSDSMERRESARRFTENPISSDEDLARSLGYRTKPELLEKTASLPRPAPVADLELFPSAWPPGPFANTSWVFPNLETSPVREDGASTENVRDPMPSPRGGRRVSWFDVGGLLENSASGPSPTDSVIAHDFAIQPRRGSRASSTVVSNHRAFSTSVRRSNRLSQQSYDYETLARPSHQSQDFGAVSSENPRTEAAVPTSSPHSSSPHVPQEAPASLRRSSTRTSYDVPSLRDPGGLLSMRPPSAPVQRTNTHTSYDTPSLQDAGGLLSSPPFR